MISAADSLFNKNFGSLQRLLTEKKREEKELTLHFEIKTIAYDAINVKIIPLN